MIKKANLDEIAYIYHNYLYYDFPEDERKPLKMIQEYAKTKRGETVLYYVDEELIGYACVIYAHNLLFLDYFATLKDKRGQGLGTSFLKELKDYYHDYEAIYLETEANNNEEAKKRLSFYEKAGCINSFVKCNTYYVDYYILTLSSNEVSDVRENMQMIYKTIYDDKFYNKYIKWY